MDKLIKLIDPFRDHWIIYYDDESHEFDHKPTMDEIKEVVINYYNEICDDEILKNYEFKGIPVWLSEENKFNYTMEYILNKINDGKFLPTVFKLGTDDNPEYYPFNNMAELEEFTLGALTHIRSTLTKYWNIKTKIDFSQYE